MPAAMLASFGCHEVACQAFMEGLTDLKEAAPWREKATYRLAAVGEFGADDWGGGRCSTTPIRPPRFPTSRNESPEADPLFSSPLRPCPLVKSTPNRNGTVANPAKATPNSYVSHLEPQRLACAISRTWWQRSWRRTGGTWLPSPELGRCVGPSGLTVLGKVGAC